MSFLNNYKNVILDMDGTIIDSEEIHYNAYQEAFQSFGLKKKIPYNEHIILAHSNDIMLKDYMSNLIPFVTWQEIYNMKTEILINKLERKNIKLMPHIENFLDRCFELNKKIVVVTNSPVEIVNILKNKIPLLKKIKYWITQNDVFYKKPHPQPYLKAIYKYDLGIVNTIGFEDSLKGYISMRNTGINVNFINDKKYPLYDKVNEIRKGENIFSCFKDFLNYMSNKEKKNFTYNNSNSYSYNYNSLEDHINDYNKFILHYITHNITHIEHLIRYLGKFILAHKYNLYFMGVGYTELLCKKITSIWNSIGISCHTLNVLELNHGGYGIINDNDLIIIISKSGKTKELVSTIKYIKNNFNVYTIGITLHKKAIIMEYVNEFFYIRDDNNNGTENDIDDLDDNFIKYKTISPIIFTILFDMLGIYISKKKTNILEEYQKNNPKSPKYKI